MKHLVIFTVLVCLFGALSHKASAQTGAPWVEVSPSGEHFRISMPHAPREENATTRYGALNVTGKFYVSSDNGASYEVWALVNKNDQSTRDVDEYLDGCAEMIWEGLLKPARDKLPDDRRVRAAMTYIKELPAKPLPGREYTLTIGDLTGTTQFYIDEGGIYVLLATNSPGGAWLREKFFESFTISNPPIPKTLDAKPIIVVPPVINRAINTDATDYNRVFNGRDVTQKARVLSKPEPTYTESARKFGVQGTVVLRVVFSKDGEVTNIYVSRKLPHGLTQQSIKAARGIKFSPALKDDHPVSMYMQLEYNFNLY